MLAGRVRGYDKPGTQVDDAAVVEVEQWDASVDRFVKVMPHDYKRALAELEEPAPEQQPEPEMAPPAGARG